MKGFLLDKALVISREGYNDSRRTCFVIVIVFNHRLHVSLHLFYSLKVANLQSHIMTTPISITDMPRLSARALDSHKGTFGKVLIVAGSRGMSGAAVLCGSAALRSGAGLVQVATPADVQAVVAAGNPCYTTATLHADGQGHLNEDVAAVILDLARSATVLALGPGLGHAGKMSKIMEYVLVQATIPIVLDADGINALTQSPIDVLQRREAPTVLTPHPGEFARLIHKTIAEVQQQRQELAVAYAAHHRAVLVLKGHGTLVTDGQRLYCNTTGNPGMAKGGTGDVLTGIIAALIAQGLAPFEAAQLGVYVHGRAGDRAATAYGQVSMTATDLLEHLPQSFQEMTIGQ